MINKKLQRIVELDLPFSPDELGNIYKSLRSAYQYLKPVFDSGVLSNKSALPLSDYNYHRYYRTERVLNPQTYFKFYLGVIRCELIRSDNDFFSVRVHSFDFTNDFLNSLKNVGYYSDIVHEVVKIDVVGNVKGWFYLGKFKLSDFRLSVGFFSYITRVILTNLTGFDDCDDTNTSKLESFF